MKKLKIMIFNFAVLFLVIMLPYVVSAACMIACPLPDEVKVGCSCRKKEIPNDVTSTTTPVM